MDHCSSRVGVDVKVTVGEGITVIVSVGEGVTPTVAVSVGEGSGLKVLVCTMGAVGEV